MPGFKNPGIFTNMTLRSSMALMFCMIALQAMPQKPDRLLEDYNHKYPQEKIHLHFDKDTYVAGETIWFKAYLLSDLLPDTISSSLFIELINPAGKVTVVKNLPIFDGTVIGNIELPDSLPPGFYKLWAYTAWMLNFDNNFLYTKNIFIYDDTGLPSIPGKNETYTVDFFPEGGNMVADVVNFVAFKGTDGNGLPVSFSGTVEDAKGNSITELKTSHDGMGRFTLLPAASEKYFAQLKFENGKVATVQLPVAAPGVAMHVDRNSKDLRITFLRSPENVRQKQSLIVLGQMENHVAFQTQTVLTGESSIVAIPVSGFPSGILQITLFADSKPIQERLTFINNNEYKLLSHMAEDTFNISKHAKNVFTFSVPDTVSGSYSVSITDDSKNAELADKDDIVSRFLLSDDIKGYVHNPSFYFRNDDKASKDALELVMMTNGWRRFRWEELVAGQLPKIKFLPLPFIQISGKVYNADNKDLVRGGDLNFFFTGKSDSTTTFFTVPIDQSGEFKIDSLIYSDTATLYSNYNTKNKNKKEVALKLDQNSTWPLVNLPAITFLDVTKNIPLPDSLRFKLGKQREQVKYYNEYARKVISLKEIKIKTRKKSPEQRVNDRYTTSLFNPIGARTVDLVNHPIPNGSKLSNLIRSQFPRVEVQGSGSSMKIVKSTTTSVMAGKQPVTIYLDEVETDIGYIENLPISEIALLKYTENFTLAPSNGPAIFIYSKKIEDLAATSGSYVSKFTFPGYSVTKEFYSPDYSVSDAGISTRDNRATLYWNPEILLDKSKQKQTFQFYNSDDCHKMKVVIEGFNNAGKLCHLEKMLAN
ncbi:MAG: hypothetical protein ABJA57_05335 [Ginsengibacter sp.]